MFRLLYSTTKIIINLIDSFVGAIGVNGQLEPSDYSNVAIFLLIFSCLSLALFFIVKSIAVQTLLKRAGEKHSYLAFVPFVNYFYFGKIIGKTRIFGIAVPNLGLLVAIFLPLNIALGAVLDVYSAFDEFYLLITDGTLVNAITYETTPLITAISLVRDAVLFSALFFVATFNLRLLTKYSRKNTFIYSFLLFFAYAFDIAMLIYLPVFACILVALRNKEPFDPAAHIRGRAQTPKAAAELSAMGEPFSEFNDNNSGKQIESPLKQDIFVDKNDSREQ